MGSRGGGGIDGLLRSRFVGVGIGLVVFAVLALARLLGWLAPLELRAHDAYVALRAELTSSAAPDAVTLVRIREQDITRFRHPVSDADLAEAIRRLLAMGPRAVAVDLYRNLPVGEGREALAAVARDPRVAFVFQLPGASQAGVPPPEFGEGAGQRVLSDVVVDPDGVVRRGLVYMWDDAGEAHPSLAWWLALAYLGGEPEPLRPGPGWTGGEERSAIALGEGEVWRFRQDDGGYVDADDGDYQLLLDYARGTRPFRAVSFSDVMDGAVDPGTIRDAVVILGTAAPSVKDDFVTPLGPPEEGPPVTKGVEVHAQIVDQLLRTAFLGATPTRTLSDAGELFWLLVWCLAWGVVGNHVHSTRRALQAGVVGVLLLAGSFPLFLLGWWVPVVPPALAWVGAGGLAAGVALVRERRDRVLLDRLLSVHVSGPVRDRLWEERDRFLEDGRVRARRTWVTVLMTDLEGFTSASEHLGDPGVVMRWLNEYMDRMVPVIEQHGGVVDGYWGDAIKADFGAPVPPESEEEIDHNAQQAVACALAMGEAMKELITGWRADGLPPVRMRIGLCTGPAVTGSQGSRSRQKFTSLGDTVNTAARLEAFDKEGFSAEDDPTACRILVAESTRLRLGGRFALEPRGQHALKGKGELLAIHRVLGPAPGRGAGADSA